MPFRQLFFIEGKLLGEATRGLTRVHETYQEPTSDLYFCACCGTVFASCPVIRADGTSTCWQSYRSMCRRCGDSGRQRFLTQWPGSIWRDYAPDFTAALPVAVLQWELNCHLSSYDRIGDFQ